MEQEEKDALESWAFAYQILQPRPRFHPKHVLQLILEILQIPLGL